MHRRLSRAAAVAAVAVIAAVSTVTAGPAGRARAAEPTAPGGFTVAPALSASGQPRGYFKLSAAAGHSAMDVVSFGNDSSSTERLRVGVTNGVTATNSGSAYGNLTSRCSGTACWVIGIPKTVTLAPHTSEEIEFEVKVPDGTSAAQYLAGITASPETASRPVKLNSGKNSSTQVVIVPRVVIGVAVTVGKLSAMKVRTTVTGVTAGWVSGLPRLTVDVRNSGQRFTQGSGKLSCASGGSRHSFGLSMDTVLPGTGAGLPVNATGLSQGTWQCSVHLTETGGTTVSWTGKVNVPASSPAKTKRVSSPAGSAAYEAPSGGIPAWAIGLMVVGGLLLFTLWAMFLRRERNRRLSRS
jgi:hypothetical protein